MRRLALALALVVALSLALVAWPPVAAQQDPEARLVQLINEYRAANGRSPLSVDTTLTAAARWLSNDMLEKDYFSPYTGTTSLIPPGPNLRLQVFAHVPALYLTDGHQNGHQCPCAGLMHICSPRPWRHRDNPHDPPSRFAMAHLFHFCSRGQNVPPEPPPSLAEPCSTLSLLLTIFSPCASLALPAGTMTPASQQKSPPAGTPIRNMPAGAQHA
jgi:hypothetical protein